MRDLRQTIAALERKAADPACAGSEATALRAKANELRAKLPDTATEFERLCAQIQREWESMLGNVGGNVGPSMSGQTGNGVQSTHSVRISGVTVTYAGPGENMTPEEARRGAPRWVRWNGRFD